MTEVLNRFHAWDQDFFRRVYTTVNRESCTGGTTREKTRMRLHTPVQYTCDRRCDATRYDSHRRIADRYFFSAMHRKYYVEVLESVSTSTYQVSSAFVLPAEGCPSNDHLCLYVPAVHVTTCPSFFFPMTFIFAARA